MIPAPTARERADALQLPRVTELDIDSFMESGVSIPEHISEAQGSVLEVLELVQGPYDVDLVYALRSAWRDLDLALAVMAVGR